MVKQERDKIIIEARSWIGVKWRHQGRTRQGIDCAGLIIKVAHGVGLSAFDYTSYQARPKGLEFLNIFRTHMDEKNVLDALPGDVLLFRDGPYLCHSAIVAELNNTPSIIHAYAITKKVVEERLNQGDWLSRRVTCFSYRGVDI